MLVTSYLLVTSLVTSLVGLLCSQTVRLWHGAAGAAGAAAADQQWDTTRPVLHESTTEKRQPGSS